MAGVAVEDEKRFTHLDDAGRAVMVDVSNKEITARRATARCVVRTSSAQVLDDPWLRSCAQVAGIQAAKATSSLIPLCHPLPVDATSIEVTTVDGRVEITATAEVLGRTGVEMEALSACTVAGLSLVTSLLESDPAASIDEVQLLTKAGGRTGTWVRPPAARPTPSDA